MAILVAKVLFLVWAAQLIWIASNLLESRVKKISRLVTTLAIQKDRPKAASLQRWYGAMDIRLAWLCWHSWFGKRE
jgi:hypothetical protein